MRTSQLTAVASGVLGGILTYSLLRRPEFSADIRPVHGTGGHAAFPGRVARSSWGALRPTACDGASMGGVATSIPPNASIGRFSGRYLQLLRTLVDRNGLASLANALKLTGNAVELGVWRGEFAEHNIKTWQGKLYVLVDLWKDTDCVGGNRSLCGTCSPVLALMRIQLGCPRRAFGPHAHDRISQSQYTPGKMLAATIRWSPQCACNVSDRAMQGAT